MTKRKLMSLCIISVTLTTGLAGADKLRFTNAGRDGDWANPANWLNESNPTSVGVPAAEDTTRFINGVSVKITNEVTCGAIHLASTGSATLIVDGGSLVTTSPTAYNSASYTSQGSIIVQNKGSATFSGRFFVGFSSAPSGSLVIHEGTVRVANTYYHNETYSGTELLGTRTTINTGGLLDVDELVLNAGVMDVAGGTVIVRRRLFYGLDQWISEGRIIAMGGEAGWKIKATLDEATGWTTIIAEPVTDPFTVGRLNPVMPALFRPAS